MGLSICYEIQYSNSAVHFVKVEPNLIHHFQQEVIEHPLIALTCHFRTIMSLAHSINLSKTGNAQTMMQLKNDFTANSRRFFTHFFTPCRKQTQLTDACALTRWYATHVFLFTICSFFSGLECKCNVNI